MVQEKKRPQILVAEDEPALLKMLDRVLSTFADIDIATDGQEAFEKIQKGPHPDLVITDVMMPRMDGLVLAKNLKSDPNTKSIPVIVLTARTTPRDVIAGINAGARFYITKPFKTDELLGKIQKALGVNP